AEHAGGGVIQLVCRGPAVPPAAGSRRDSHHLGARSEKKSAAQSGLPRVRRIFWRTTDFCSVSQTHKQYSPAFWWRVTDLLALGKEVTCQTPSKRASGSR